MLRNATPTLLAALVALATTTTTNAQPRDIRPPPLASWWLLPAQEPAPAVVVRGGEGGSHCDVSGCVVWAQGDWLVVVVDGVVLAERGRVYLPQVRR